MTMHAPLYDPVWTQATEIFREPADIFVRGVHGIQERMAKAWSDGSREFLMTAQSLGEQTRKHVEEAQTAYVASLRELTGSEGAGRAQEEAYAKYVKLLQEAAGESQKRYEDAARKYAETVNQLSAGITTEWADLYGAYLRGLQAAWARLDIDAVVAACTGIRKTT